MRPHPPINSPRAIARLASEPRPSVSTADGRGNSHNTVGRHGPVHTKLSDELREYLGNQPRLVRRRSTVTKIDIGDIVVVTLGTGFKVLLDVDDAAFAYTHYLWVHTKSATPYVNAIDIETKRSSRLSRAMFDVPKGMVVDHINGDGLDNRRANLRIVSSRQNNQNRAKMRGTSSRYKGVSRRDGRWFAYLYVDYKQVRLGLFDDEADAARAYDAAARQRFGSCAALNFPLPGEQSAHRRDSIINFHSAASNHGEPENNADQY